MKFLKNYFLAFLILLSFVAFGYTATVKAESGNDDDAEEVDDSGKDSDSDMNDSDEDSNEDESDEYN